MCVIAFERPETSTETVSTNTQTTQPHAVTSHSLSHFSHASRVCVFFPKRLVFALVWCCKQCTHAEFHVIVTTTDRGNTMQTHTQSLILRTLNEPCCRTLNTLNTRQQNTANSKQHTQKHTHEYAMYIRSERATQKPLCCCWAAAALLDDERARARVRFDRRPVHE